MPIETGLHDQGEIEVAADKVRTLYLEKQDCLAKKTEHIAAIRDLNDRIVAIDSELKRLFSGNTSSKCSGMPSEIPKTGLVHEMVSVMSADTPMTLDEIRKELEKKKVKFKENSLRSYLSNVPCFKAILKNDPRGLGKGWIYLKDKLTTASEQ